MIDQFVADYSGSFADYDVNSVRGSVGKLDGKLDKLFSAMLSSNGGASPTADVDIQTVIDTIRKQYGDAAAEFYDSAYGCALTERMERTMAAEDAVKEPAE